MRRGKQRPPYAWVRAWGAWRQYPQDVIEAQVQHAVDVAASQRVVYFDPLNGHWYTIDDLAPAVREQLIQIKESAHGFHWVAGRFSGDSDRHLP